MSEATPLGRPGELTGRLQEAQVVVQVDPRLCLLEQDHATGPPPDLPRRGRGKGPGVDVVGPQLEAPPIPGEPLDQESTIGMPADPRDVAVVAPEIHPGRRTAVD